MPYKKSINVHKFNILAVIVVILAGCSTHSNLKTILTDDSTFLSEEVNAPLTIEDFEKPPSDFETDSRLFGTGFYRTNGVWQEFRPSSKQMYLFHSDGTGYYVKNADGRQNAWVSNTGFRTTQHEIYYRANNNEIIILYTEDNSTEAFSYSISETEEALILNLGGIEYRQQYTDFANRIRGHVRNALDAKARNDYAIAIEEYNKAINIYHSSQSRSRHITVNVFELFMGRAEAYFLEGDDDKGYNDIQTIMDNWPNANLETIYYFLAVTLEERRSWYRAFVIIRSGRDSLSINGEIRNNINYNEALDIFSSLIEKYPYYSPLKYFRSLVYIGLRQYSHAMDDVNDILSINPNDYDALWRRADINRLMGNIFAAAADYSEVRKANGGQDRGEGTANEFYRVNQVIREAEFLQVADDPGAINNYMRMLAANPDDSNTKAILGMLYINQGNRYFENRDYINALLSYNEAVLLGYGVQEQKTAWEAYCREQSQPLPNVLNGTWKIVIMPQRIERRSINNDRITFTPRYVTHRVLNQHGVYETRSVWVGSNMHVERRPPIVLENILPEYSLLYNFSGNTVNSYYMTGVIQNQNVMSSNMIFFDGRTLRFVNGVILRFENGILIDNEGRPFIKQ